MKKLASSPGRHTFQRDGYLERCTKEGKEPNPDLIKMYESWKKMDEEKIENSEWQQYNLEYDLRSTPWIVEKCKKDSYAQNLYAAMCNNQFAKFTQTGDQIETFRNLRGDYWSASWRSAGGIVADLRGEGDYIDWYCSGIQNFASDEADPNFNGGGYVPESEITDEIRDDLAKLGWVGFPYED